MSRVVIFGGTGIVGTEICRQLDTAQVPYLSLSSADVDVLNEPMVLDVLRTERPSVIFNSVAMVGWNRCEDSPVQARRVNSEFPVVLARFATDSDSKLIHFSSHAVFGDLVHGRPQTESDEPNPLNVYAESKLQADIDLMNSYASSLIVRLASVFTGNLDTPRGMYSKLFSALSHSHPVQVPDDKWDSPTYVSDAVAATLMLIATDATGLHHVANAGQRRIVDFVREFCNLRGVPERLIEPVPESILTKGLRTPLNGALASERPTISARLRDGSEALIEAFNEPVGMST